MTRTKSLFSEKVHDWKVANEEDRPFVITDDEPGWIWGMRENNCLTVQEERVLYSQPTFIGASYQLPSGGAFSLILCRHVCSGPIYWGVIYLEKRIIRWWYFIWKEPGIIICDDILHVNMFHYLKISYIVSTFFTKFTYNEYIGPCFLSHVVLKLLPVPPPPQATTATAT